MAIKLKRYGKNLKGLKTIISLEGTKVYLGEHEAKRLFESLIGYEFIFKPCKCGFEAIGYDGESFRIETTQIIEII